ncbi:MAG: BREX system ATP-binding domain-containing protein [Verrucomicrobiota bacterium]
MKPLIAIASSFLFCSCADMHVTKTDVATAGGAASGPVDTKDFGSQSIHMVTNCGVGATDPKAIYIRPFCIDTAVFKGDQANSEGEMPIRKALAPIELANDLKEQLEKIAPARILRDNQTPRVGWLVEGQFDLVDGGSPLARFFFGHFGAGRSFLALHVKVTDVEQGVVVYEFDMAGGSNLQGIAGTVRASGLGKATHFDLQNAAERVYLTLSANPYRFGTRANVSLQ